LKINKKSIFILLITFLILTFLGFLREYVFEGINEFLGQLYYHYENPKIRKGLSIFEKFDYWELYYIKFVLTGLFASLYFLITYFSLKLIFTSKKTLLFTLVYFLGIFSFAFIFYLMAYLGTPEKFYMVSRRLAEFVQSPLALMILFPALLISEKKS
jgi:hypothetical protein